MKKIKKDNLKKQNFQKSVKKANIQNNRNITTKYKKF